MDPLTILAIASVAAAGWKAFRHFKPGMAKKAQDATAIFRPAWDAVEALRRSGLIPGDVATATSYFVQFLDAAGLASDKIEEGLKWAKVWAKDQPRSQRVAYKSIGDRARMAQPKAYAEELRKSFVRLGQGADRVIARLEQLKRLELLPPPAMTEIPPVPSLEVKK